MTSTHFVNVQETATSSVTFALNQTYYELSACVSFPIFLYNDGRLGLHTTNHIL